MIDKKELFSLEGEVEDLIYQNDDTGYTVCVIDWNNEPTTLVGTLPSLMVGDVLRAMGQWVQHPTYGKQFKVHYFEKAMPADENSILRYLSSRAIKGVGPVLAKRIVSHFGESTLDVIENNPDLLSDIPGISVRKAREISENFREQFGVRNIMMFFGSYFGTTTSLRIYKKWGGRAVEIVKQNPYLVCEHIRGIGFDRADAMAAEMGMANDSPDRIRAGLFYVLRYNAASNGHSYLPREKLIEATAAKLSLEKGIVRETLLSLTKNLDLICNASRPDYPVYLPEYFKAESFAASRLVELSRINLIGSVEGVERLIRETQESEGMEYAPNQKKAIHAAIDHSVSVLTGGPGTGKTTIIKAIVNIFRRVGLEVALAAPTGRAAKRMSQSTGFEAKTVHRLLEMEFRRDDEPRFVRNEKNPLEEEVIIVDELSMVDVLLFSSLLRAIRPGSRLIMIGDSDQLPSVGAGEVLCDTIECGLFPVSRLDRIFRQSDESYIVENAHRINRGEMPLSSQKNGDFFFMIRNELRACADTVISLCSERLPNRYGADIMEGVQVLTCTRKGELGTQQLNLRLQEALNPEHPDKNQKAFGSVIFRERDKVMQIRNNYDAEWVDKDNEDITGFGIFNGDIGTIFSIDTKAERIVVDFSGKLVTYPFEDIHEIEHAFAVTVHKSQGSEYPVVILPVLNPPPMLATRNLLYTAVTRAKNMVILVGNQHSVRKMLDNCQKEIRYTDMRDMYRVFMGEKK